MNYGDWDLASFYSGIDAPDYRSDRALYKERLAQLVADANQQPLAELVQAWEKLLILNEHLSTYLVCQRSADGRDQKVAQELAALQADGAQLRQLEVVLGERLRQLSNAEFEQLCASPGLEQLEHYLGRARQRALWQMNGELENLAADLDVDGLSAWGRLYDQVSGRLEFTYQDAEGQPKTVPMSLKNSLLEEPDAAVRRSVLEGSNQAWKAVEDVCAAALNAIAGTRHTLYKRRGIPHFLEPALFDSAIESATLEAMLEAIRSCSEWPRQYLRKKAEILGVPRLGFQDLSAPLPRLEHTSVPWPEGGRLLVDETRATYPRFAEFCEESLRDRWVDFTPREGKRSGGFCIFSTRLRQSRIFMTYHGAFGDLMTLTHEFGHAFHSHVMDQERPLNLFYPMTLAETASTYAENLLIDALLRSPKTSPEQRLKLLDSRMERAAAFLLNIPSRFYFEKRFYEERERGEVSLDRIKELMLQAQRECYGDSLDEGQLDPYFWASKLHFYITEISFYNFPYAFGYLFSLGVYARAQQQGQAFLPVYERLLQATGRRTAEQIAQDILGVDLRKPDFWMDSLQLVKQDLDDFERLAEEIYARV